MRGNGQTFGHYQLQARISVGGMAEIFRALHTKSGQIVALKRILPDIAADEDFLDAFQDEARIARELKHPNIARIIEIGRVGTNHFIAFEFVEGKPLRTLMDRSAAHGQRLPLPITIHCIGSLARALAYAHEATDRSGRPLGLVHRDVSPQNALIAHDGQVKLIDFGIAKAAGKLSSTRAGDIKGKIGYMSPEQVRGGDVDRRADIFSLGICFWECLTGERLFAAANELLVMEQIRSKKIVPPSSINPQVPRDLDGIVLKALAKDPNQRYATASQLDADLTAFSQAHALHADRSAAASFMQHLFPEEHAASTAQAYQESNRMSDKGGSDLDVFDGLASKKKARPSGPPSRGPAGPPRQKTLLGMSAPMPPPPSRGGPQSRRPGPPSGRGSLPPPPVPSRPPSASGAPPPPGGAPKPPPAAAPVDMDWDDEDEKTSIYDKASNEDAAKALLRSNPPPAAGAPSSRSGGAAALAGASGGAAAPPPPAPAPAPAPVPQSAMPTMPASQVPQAAVHVSAAPPPVAEPQSGGGARTALLAVAALLVVVLIGAVVMLVLPKDGTLVVTVAGPGNRQVDALQVFVDGAKKCDASPCRVDGLKSGTHTVKVAAAGYQATAPQAVTVQAGQEAAHHVVLAAASAGTGIKVSAKGSGLKLYVDGKEVGPLPQELKDMTPGDHQIKVAGGDRYEEWEKKITVVPDKMEEIGPLELEVLKGLAIIKKGEGASGAKIVLVSGRERRPIPENKLPIKLEIDTKKKYTLTAKKKGYQDYEKEITFDDGTAEKTFTIEMVEIGKEPPPVAVGGGPAPVGGGPKPPDKGGEEKPATGNGTLNINSIPVSNVILDGRPLGSTPKVGISVPAGAHTVVFVHSEHGRKVRSAQVGAGQTKTVAVRFP